MKNTVKDFYNYVVDNYGLLLKKCKAENKIEKSVFISYFPLEELDKITKEQYDEIRNKESFCNLLEHNTRSFGKLKLTNNRNKYFYQEDKTREYKVYNVAKIQKYISESTDIDMQFTAYIKDMKIFIETFDVEKYDPNNFLPDTGAIKTQIILLYHDNKLLSINTAKYIKKILKYFGQKANGNDSIALNIQLINTLAETYEGFFTDFPNKVSVSNCLWQYFIEKKEDFLEKDNIEENLFDEEIYEERDKDLAIKKAPKPTELSGGRKVYKRDPRQKIEALLRAQGFCEGNKNHKSFTSARTKERYLESHHLVPRSAQKDFDKDIDHYYNIVALCSECHNLLHYGVFNEKKHLLSKLYNDRKELLAGVTIRTDKQEMNIDLLCEYYK